MSESPSEFVVELPLFSGPFRLMADLILEQRMDVCDVPVARVIERFIEYGSEQLDGWSLEEATWFLAVCAALLELKVGRLLPRAPVETEEELLGGASPDLVYARSLELAAFRRVAAALSELASAAALSVPRTAAPPLELAHLYPDLLEKITPQTLREAAAALLAPARDLDLSHVTPIRLSLAEGLRAVQEHLAVKQNARFRDLLEDCEERIEVVVRFLALLELYREGKVELSQANVFGDIEVRWQGPTVRVSEPPHEHAADLGVASTASHDEPRRGRQAGSPPEGDME
ncbi:MAG TPA: ScpA family protein [Actinomycetota bacterium]